MKTSTKSHWENIYARLGKNYGLYGFQEHIVDAILRHLHPVAGAKVLEVGFGKGNELLQLHGAGASCTGLDFSSVAVRMFTERISDLGTDIGIVRGDALHIPLRENMFDVVFSQGVLEHFRDPGVLLREQYRVLKPGGLVCIEVPNRWNSYTLYKHALMAAGKWAPGWEKSFSPRELMRLTESVGFKTVSASGWDALSAKVVRKVSKSLGRKESLQSPLMRRLRHATEQNPLLLWFFLSLVVVARKPLSAA